MGLNKAHFRKSLLSALICDHVTFYHFKIVSTLVLCNNVFIIIDSVAFHGKIFDSLVL